MRIHRNAIQPTNRPIRMQRRHRDKKRQKNDRTSSMDGALTVVSFLCSFFSLKLILINTQMWISVSFLMVSHSGYSEWILCLYGRAVESDVWSLNVVSFVNVHMRSAFKHAFHGFSIYSFQECSHILHAIGCAMILRFLYFYYFAEDCKVKRKSMLWCLCW